MNSDCEGGGRVDKIWKSGGSRQYVRRLHKVGGLAPLCQLCKKTLKIAHPPPPPPIPGSPSFPVKVSHHTCKWLEYILRSLEKRFIRLKYIKIFEAVQESNKKIFSKEAPEYNH